MKVIVSARLEIDELYKYFDLEQPEGKFATVGGWIVNKTGYIPRQGEILDIDGLEITVENADERTIKKVKVRNAQQMGEAAETSE